MTGAIQEINEELSDGFVSFRFLLTIEGLEFSFSRLRFTLAFPIALRSFPLFTGNFFFFRDIVQ